MFLYTLVVVLPPVVMQLLLEVGLHYLVAQAVGWPLAQVALMV